jgi:hypothetical protein
MMHDGINARDVTKLFSRTIIRPAKGNTDMDLNPGSHIRTYLDARMR